MITLLAMAALQSGQIEIPGWTVYLAPNPEAFRVDEGSGVQGWNDPGTKVVWYGKLVDKGELWATVKVDPAKPMAKEFRMRFDGRTHIGSSDKAGMFSFGPLRVREPGYRSFELSARGARGEQLGVPLKLILSGPASKGAQFNLKPRRNAASVHLGYPTQPEAKITAFYCESRPISDPVHTFYMSCGFRRGYFGIQVNSPAERRVIFSIWDAGNEAVDRTKVADENRVKLLAKGEGVYASDFGNEGTGGHSHLKYRWRLGDTFRFLVRAKPQGTFTNYTSYFWFPDRKAWGLISSFRAPKDGGYLKGLHSFVENFWGTTGHLRRRVEFRNQWIQTDDDKWTRLEKARFTCDPTGRADRFDYAAGRSGGGFFLQNGGFQDNGVKYGDEFVSIRADRPPDDLPK